MRRFASLSILFALMLILPAAAQEATPAPEGATGTATTSAVIWLPETAWAGSTVPGAVSSLATYDEGASMALTTSGLTPGHTVTIWWVIFNHPEHCNHGQAPARCGEGDLLIAGGDEAVEGTALAATGHVIGPAGSGHFDAYLAVGDTSRVVGSGPGLTNPLGAEIHFVVRDHGPMQTGLLGEQLTTFGGGCNNAPEGPGEPGDFACVNLQFAAHLQ